MVNINEIRETLIAFPGYVTYDNITTILRAYVGQTVFTTFFPLENGFRGDYKDTLAAIYARNDNELKIHLDKFRDFAGCHMRFGWDTRVYRIQCKHSQSYRGAVAVNSYIYKQDSFSLLVNHMSLIAILDHNHFTIEIIDRLCAVYLKHREEELLNGSCEFLPLSVYEYRVFEGDLKLALIKPDSNRKPNFVTCKKAIKKAMKDASPNIDLSPVDDLMEKLEKLLKFADYQKEYKTIVKYTSAFIAEAEKFIKARPTWFERNESYTSKLRFFDHGAKRFFLASELLNEIRQTNLDGGEFEMELEGLTDPLATVDFEEVRKKWSQHVQGCEFDDVEMIHTDVLRTNHHAVYIPSNKTKHCVLVADAILELFREWISVKKVFQVIKPSDQTMWADFCRIILGELFKLEPKLQNMDSSAPMLIDVECVEKINTTMNDLLDEHYGEILKDVKEVKGVTIGRGFDMYGLRVRTQAMGLQDAFPNIVRILEILYPRIEGNKAQLTTTDMYEILEQAQLLAIFLKLPMQFEWFCTQGFDRVYPFDFISYEDLRRLLDAEA